MKSWTFLNCGRPAALTNDQQALKSICILSTTLQYTEAMSYCLVCKIGCSTDVASLSRCRATSRKAVAALELSSRVLFTRNMEDRIISFTFIFCICSCCRYSSTAPWWRAIIQQTVRVNTALTWTVQIMTGKLQRDIVIAWKSAASN